MVIKNVELETVVGVTTKKLPNNKLPEIAFAGRSNVGKSSLINALMNRKSLARVSATPGKTQTMNFYNINKELYFVDLPGYGYAKVHKDFRASWGPMIENYLLNSKNLAAVFLLLDLRRTPSEDDKMMYDWMVHAGFHPIIIATKSDKIRKNDLEKAINNIKNTLGTEVSNTVLKFSALKKTGRDEILAKIDEILQSKETEND
ncbi:MAG: ribosome biogenesis GTP-binding protein YihA/YsxC [Lachnospiraceae bacterium]|nr:ribosome biogenesis GTP-binding protein YihA/YsxC [Lachnospiraceae bacterium]